MKLFSIAGMGLLLLSFFCIYINTQWKKFNDPLGFNLRMLQSYNVLSRMWPTDERFLSLTFSVLRHYFVAIVFGFLIWFVNIRFLNSMLLSLNCLYMLLSIFRYLTRRKEYKSLDSNIYSFILPVKKACAASAFYGVLAHIMLFFIYGLRP